MDFTPQSELTKEMEEKKKTQILENAQLDTVNNLQQFLWWK